MGNYTTASGGSAAAIGYHTAASGLTSAAIGNFVTASGDFSTAMGSYVSTNTRNGSFIIGDNSSSSLIAANTDDNQFMAVFAGGYRVWSNRNGTQGVYMNGGTSGWTNISDRNLKENFRPIDGEGLLAKIRMLPITEWNYRGADPSIRYVGPVAQDFHEAFHLGGADSLGINSICMDGVSMAAVQALEKRTAELREKAAELEVVKAELADVKARLRRLEAALTMQRDVTREITAVTAEAAERR
jgi:hypothetical protein